MFWQLKWMISMKVRIKYSKTGPLKFISHLDVMRYFQKAIRRADIDICYSTGMSPHQIISFAAPMPLMMESVGEYCDAEFNSFSSSEEIVERFNAVGSPYIKMLGITVLPDDAVNSMAAVTASDYLISLTEKGRKAIISKAGVSESGEDTEEDTITKYISEAVDHINNAASIEVLKKTKRSEAVTDIKPLIYELNVKKEGIYMLIATGSHENLKPDDVLKAVFDRIGVEYDRFSYNILRLETYYGDKISGFRSLLDV